MQRHDTDKTVCTPVFTQLPGLEDYAVTLLPDCRHKIFAPLLGFKDDIGLLPDCWDEISAPPPGFEDGITLLSNCRDVIFNPPLVFDYDVVTPFAESLIMLESISESSPLSTSMSEFMPKSLPMFESKSMSVS